MVSIQIHERFGPVGALALAIALPATLQAAVLLTSALGVRLTASVAWTALALSVMAAMALATRCRPAGGDDSILFSRSTKTEKAVAVALGAWSVSVWLRCWMVAWSRPVYDWDGLYYHVPALHGWVGAGRVTWLEGLHDLPFANGYPMAVETLGFWLFSVAGTSRLVDAGNLLLWPLGAVGTYVIAAEFGARTPGRWIAAAAWPVAPAFVVFAATCYVEPAFACVAAALLAATLVWLRHPTWSGATVVGLAAGLLLGTKGLGLALVAITLSAGLVAGARDRTRETPPLVQIGLALMIALLVGGYWMGRNFVHTGNPLFPIGLGFGGWQWIDGYDAHAMIDGNLSETLRRWPPVLRPLRAWLQLEWPIRGMESSDGMGFVWLLAGMPLLLWGAIRGRCRPLGLTRWPVTMALLVLLLQPGAWWARFTLWLHALGLPAVGRALFGAAPPTSAALRVALLLLLTVGVVEAEIALHAQRSLGRVQDERGSNYLPTLDRYFPGIAESEGFAELWQEPVIARSRWGHLGTLLGGCLSLPLDRRRIHVLPAAPSPRDVQRVAERGVGWVLWDRNGAGAVPAEIAALADASFAYRRGADVDFLALRLRVEPSR